MNRLHDLAIVLLCLAAWAGPERAAMAQHYHVPPGQTNPLMPEAQALLRIKQLSPNPPKHIKHDGGLGAGMPVSVHPPASSLSPPHAPPAAGHHPSAIPPGHPTIGHDSYGLPVPNCDCNHVTCTTCRMKSRLFPARNQSAPCGVCGTPCGDSPCPTCRESQRSRFAPSGEHLDKFLSWLCFRPMPIKCKTPPSGYRPPLYSYFSTHPQPVPPPYVPPERKHVLPLIKGSFDKPDCGTCSSGTRQPVRNTLANFRPFRTQQCRTCGPCETNAPNCPGCGVGWSDVPASLQGQPTNTPPAPPQNQHPHQQTSHSHPGVPLQMDRSTPFPGR